MLLTADLLKPLADVRLTSAPVAMAFLSTPPPGIERVGHPDAAGCGYWKQASEGRTFYTTAVDHGNCPIGAFTHGVELPADKAPELQALIGTMIELKYLKSEEVPAIPHRTTPFRFAAYAPLQQANFEPDVVVFRGTARQIMLLSEAARAAGVFEAGSVMGRPACAMLPQAIASGGGIASVGCIGNRVYTGLGDDEMYLTVPGASVEAVLGHLRDTLHANAALEQFHRQRAASLGNA
jgi:uncharacterized protein (DUF169 family)